MARHFVSASQQYAEKTGVPVSAVPLTIALWLKTNTPLQAAFCAALCNAGSNGWYLLGTPTTAGTARAYEYDGTTPGYADATLAVPASTWIHFCGVFTSHSDRACFLNGANKGTSTTLVTAPALDRVTVGALWFGGVVLSTSYFDGDIAEVAFWNVALSDAEVAQLATGLAANGVRAGNLVAYYPLLGTSSPEPDVMGGTGLTLYNGPTAATHPPITAAPTGTGRMFQVF